MSYQEKQQLRTEEIEALRKATEIMQSDDVSGNAEKHLDLAQMQQKTVAALLQASGGASEQNQGVHRRVRDFLASEGRPEQSGPDIVGAKDHGRSIRQGEEND